MQAALNILREQRRVMLERGGSGLPEHPGGRTLAGCMCSAESRV